MARSALGWVLSCKLQVAVVNQHQALASWPGFLLTAFCCPVLHCDNHSLASFKDGANPPTAPSAACFVSQRWEQSSGARLLLPASARPASITGIREGTSCTAARPRLLCSAVLLLIRTVEVINQTKPRGVVCYFAFIIGSKMCPTCWRESPISCAYIMHHTSPLHSPLWQLKCPAGKFRSVRPPICLHFVVPGAKCLFKRV